MADTAAPDPDQRARNIVLVGLMGSGKSTVGRLAAQSLGFEFLDTDHLIALRTGRSIPAIFASEGEEGFRQHETEALRSLTGRQHLVIATGGGIVTQPANIPLLRQLGLVVWLDAGHRALYRRIRHSQDRPLLRNENPAETLRCLAEARQPLYEAASDLKISTDDLEPGEVAYGLTESARVAFASRPAPPA